MSNDEARLVLKIFFGFDRLKKIPVAMQIQVTPTGITDVYNITFVLF